jgi:hypothetical protein
LIVSWLRDRRGQVRSAVEGPALTMTFFPHDTMLTSAQSATIVGIVQEFKGLGRKTMGKRRQNEGHFRTTGKRHSLPPSVFEHPAHTIEYETIQLGPCIELQVSKKYRPLLISIFSRRRHIVLAFQEVQYEFNDCNRFWTRSRSNRGADIQRGKHEQKSLSRKSKEKLKLRKGSVDRRLMKLGMTKALNPSHSTTAHDYASARTTISGLGD